MSLTTATTADKTVDRTCALHTEESNCEKDQNRHISENGKIKNEDLHEIGQFAFTSELRNIWESWRRYATTDTQRLTGSGCRHGNDGDGSSLGKVEYADDKIYTQLRDLEMPTKHIFEKPTGSACCHDNKRFSKLSTASENKIERTRPANVTRKLCKRHVSKMKGAQSRHKKTCQRRAIPQTAHAHITYNINVLFDNHKYIQHKTFVRIGNISHSNANFSVGNVLSKD